VTEVVQASAAPGQRGPRWLAAPLLAFALFSLTAGLLARHQPRSKGYFRLFFSDPVHLKAGFATVAVALACFQLLSAAWIFRKLPWPRPRWIGKVHRWSGRLGLQTQAQVEQGGGSMPSFRKKLTATQIRDVAAFVASRTGQGP
jgi:Family of unknown function (DUF6529)